VQALIETKVGPAAAAGCVIASTARAAMRLDRRFRVRRMMSNLVTLRTLRSSCLEGRTTLVRAPRHVLRALLSMTPEVFPIVGQALSVSRR
jgi:hypothetical protein